MIHFKSIADLVAMAEKTEKPLANIIWEWETERSESPVDKVWEEMGKRLHVMKQAVMQGMNQPKKSFSGLAGGDACKLASGNSFIGPVVAKATAYAIAVSEVNATMGRIVACPTAGSCGIVPGAI
ncbi:MAG: L-serine ammonia-lyase, iron-sulfur-dependent, subunit alpha, partial [Veillonellales bacterium]